MVNAQWKKILADLWSNKARSLLVILSIAVGVFAVGVVASSFFVVKQDMAADYLSINPHTARIYCDLFDDDLLAALRKVPGVEAADARYNVWMKINGTDGKTYPINIDSITNVQTIPVDQLVFETGSTYLGEHEIYLERQGAAGLGLTVGDLVEIVLSDGQVRVLTLVGTVHDVHANPFKFTSSTSGYVNRSTMEWLGGSQLYNAVAIVTSGSHTDKDQIFATAEKVSDKIKKNGVEVYNINTNNPGQHPAQSIIDTVLALMAALSVLAVFLSGFLVVNTLSALMGLQIRQIGVMKAIGATFGQMIVMYMILVLAFGILALLIAVPLAALAAAELTRFLEGLLNATPLAFLVHPVSLFLQILIGLIIPLLAALVPVINGARLTVRQAITNYGITASGKPGLLDRLLESVQILPRPLILSLRNTFRRKGRLALTLSTLVLGGAIFIAVMSVRESLYLETDQSFGYYLSDINIDLARPYNFERLADVSSKVPGVVMVEGWDHQMANVLTPDGENSDLVHVYSPPAKTTLIEPVMIEGRWLVPEDENAIVVSNHFTAIRPDAKVGDVIQVRINKRDIPFTVVGVFKFAGNPSSPVTYMNREYLEKITSTVGSVNSLRVVTDNHDAARQAKVMYNLQASFRQDGLNATMQTGSSIVQQTRFQMDILIYLLLFMALLIAIVGGLGLTGTMSMNVLERTREIGVLRSIGAVNFSIFQLVVGEGILIGLISWALSILVAMPISSFLNASVGQALLKVPMEYPLARDGILLWLGIVVVLSVFASMLPARNAVRLTVRDVLAYE